MDRFADEKYELNEVEWWARWSGLTWLTEKAYVMLSQEFKEHFFNRAGFVGEESESPRTISMMESIFDGRKIQPYIHVQVIEKYSGPRAELISRGYAIVDAMSVMEMREPSFRANSEIRVELMMSEDAGKWCEAFLQSFYGDLELLNPTLEIVRRNMKRQEISFVLARYEESVVGTLATYKSRGVLGVYCVGTVPGFRRRGVANAMMQFVNDISRDAGLTMILQTMLSDGVEGLYVKMGLARVYTKDVFTKQGRLHS